MSRDGSMEKEWQDQRGDAACRGLGETEHLRLVGTQVDAGR